MGKQALCIKRSDLEIDFNTTALQGIPGNLFQLQAGLVERDICETDESLVQAIPYIAVFDKRGRIFCYERGVKGGEDRLHAKLSIGLGGHVEQAPDTELGLEAVLLLGAERELEEELGVAANVTHFMAAIYTGASGNPVDQVHLGLLSHVTLLEDVAGNEPGIIEKGRFMTLTELLLPENFDRLELWSQAVVTRMKEQLSETLGSLAGSVGGLLFEANIESATGLASSAAQEIGSITQAVADNIMGGFAMARLYDDEAALEHLSSVIYSATEAKRLLGGL